MEQQPLFSILIPTHNRRDLLQETLKSILEQNKEELQLCEILISDDASKDDTKSFLEKWKSENLDLNLSVFHHEKNLGGPANWKFLLEKSKGKYVFLLSDDDWIYPTFLKRYHETIEQYPRVELLYSAIDYRDQNMKPLSISTLSSVPGMQSGLERVKNQLRANHMVMSTMYLRSKLVAAGGWQGDYGTCIDAAAFANTAILCSETYFIDTPHFIFRVGTESWSSFKIEKQKNFYIWFRKIIDSVLQTSKEQYPHEVSYLQRCYSFHAQGVLNMLDIKILNGNLSQKNLLRLLRDLISVYPEVLQLSSFYKMVLVALFGSGWLVFLRKILNKPNIKDTSVFERRTVN